MSQASTCRRHSSKRARTRASVPAARIRGIAASLVVVIALFGTIPAAAEPLEFEGRIEPVRRGALQPAKCSGDQNPV
jgi:hypothetical protein